MCVCVCVLSSLSFPRFAPTQKLLEPEQIKHSKTMRDKIHTKKRTSIRLIPHGMRHAYPINFDCPAIEVFLSLLIMYYTIRVLTQIYYTYISERDGINRRLIITCKFNINNLSYDINSSREIFAYSGISYKVCKFNR